jgi:hypothetical protein
VPVKWVLLESYGDEVLGLVRKIDNEDCQRHVAHRLTEQQVRHIEFEHRAAEKAVEIKIGRCSCLVRHVKENCVISGMGW